MMARLLFAVVLMVVSALFLWQFPPSAAPAIPHFDKLVHVSLFFILAACLHYAFALPHWLAFLLLLGYGVVIELVQGLTPSRSADGWDVLADAAGALSYYLLFACAKQVKRRVNGA
ncbi:VanZ family protein [Idiomarina xiamenensis]|uniref:VanZ-like domain-containing protein n=1 Tax=Idiomarina xiamenensis 10-D-4 TaxID=740709 RepID=K2JW32_9GAMM|nr:VanZ family protein [Idiomarina xiamenensis]EKE87601.1 hypothetical protein A10D4_00865 [Idiomarina xiamenensis 10-D-4]